MIDSLRGLGQQLLFRGYNTPFVSIGSAYMYPSLEQAKDAITAAGVAFTKSAPVLGDTFPLTCVFTGKGAVSEGAQEIFKLLPHEFVDPADLATVKEEGDPAKLYGTVVQPGDYSERIEPGEFDMTEYCSSPELYK
jgi:alpha-aminoadipic semialdehyde synthase